VYTGILVSDFKALRDELAVLKAKRALAREFALLSNESRISPASLSAASLSSAEFEVFFSPGHASSRYYQKIFSQFISLALLNTFPLCHTRLLP